MHTSSAAGLGFIAGRWPLDSSLPTLVFVHGAGSSSAYWSNHVEGHADRANTLAVDLPGRGRSPGPGSERIEEYAQAVEGLLDEISPPRPVPVGFSMGGAVVQQMLLDRPGMFPGAVLVSTGAKLGVLPAIFDLIENDYDTYISQVGATAASPKTDPFLLKDVIADRARCDPQVALGDFRACNSFDVRARIADIEVPVLVISAEEDMLTPPKFAAWLEANLPDVHRVHIQDAGHFVSVEQADQAGGAIRDFLDALFPGRTD
jgi:pimeloyl-ACP methyl ester carboxylesterase